MFEIRWMQGTVKDKVKLCKRYLSIQQWKDFKQKQPSLQEGSAEPSVLLFYQI